MIRKKNIATHEKNIAIHVEHQQENQWFSCLTSIWENTLLFYVLDPWVNFQFGSTFDCWSILSFTRVKTILFINFPSFHHFVWNIWSPTIFWHPPFFLLQWLQCSIPFMQWWVLLIVLYIPSYKVTWIMCNLNKLKLAFKYHHNRCGCLYTNSYMTRILNHCR